MLHGGPLDHLRSAANSAALLSPSVSVRQRLRYLLQTHRRRLISGAHTGGVVGEMTGPAPVSTFTRVARERLGVRRAIACAREAPMKKFLFFGCLFVRLHIQHAKFRLAVVG